MSQQQLLGFLVTGLDQSNFVPESSANIRVLIAEIVLVDVIFRGHQLKRDVNNICEIHIREIIIGYE